MIIENLKYAWFYFFKAKETDCELWLPLLSKGQGYSSEFLTLCVIEKQVHGLGV